MLSEREFQRPEGGRTGEVQLEIGAVQSLTLGRRCYPSKWSGVCVRSTIEGSELFKFQDNEADFGLQIRILAKHT